MVITSHLSVLLLCSILCQVTKKNKFGGFRKIYWAVFVLRLNITYSHNNQSLHVHPREERETYLLVSSFTRLLVHLGSRFALHQVVDDRVQEHSPDADGTAHGLQTRDRLVEDDCGAHDDDHALGSVSNRVRDC
jgi:hypothetical protein